MSQIINTGEVSVTKRRKYKGGLMKYFSLIAFTIMGTIAVPSIVHAADANAGKAKFQQLCASCHGANGKGDGAAAANLNPKPRNLSDAAYMKTRTDADLKNIILNGGPAVGKSATMPPWKASLQAADVDNIIAFIRTLSK
jgi:mono/diheme cytochrome c family protein